MIEEDAELVDFVNRCIKLNEYLEKLAFLEESPKIWASVLVELLKKIIEAEPNADECKKLILKILFSKEDE